MNELIKNEKILGKPYTLVGDASSDIILNGKGNVKVRFGNSFIDLVINGKVSNTFGDVKVINKVDTKNDIGDKDGWYFVTEDSSLYYKVDGTLYFIVSKKDGEDTQEEYLAINYTQNLSLKQIETVQRNMKAVIDTVDNLDSIPEGFAYFNLDSRAHYINEGGELRELYLNLSTGGVVRNRVTISTTGTSHGSGDFNIIGSNGLQLQDNSDYLNIKKDSSRYSLNTNLSGFILSNKDSSVYIDGNFISIGREPSYDYNLELDGSIHAGEMSVFNSGITSKDFYQGLSGYGYRLDNNNSEWTLEIDNLIVRKDLIGNIQASEDTSIRTVGLNKNYYFSPKGVIEDIDTDDDITYDITISGIYNISVGSKLKYESFKYYYTDEEATTPELGVKSRGILTVTEIEWDSDDDVNANRCRISATLSDNLVNEEETYPEEGDIVFVNNSTYNLYLNTVDRFPYIKAYDSSSLSQLGVLRGLTSNIDSSDISNKIGIYTTNLYAINSFLNTVTVKGNVTQTGDYTITGKMYIKGDILQDGDSYLTNAEKLQVEDHVIVVNRNKTTTLPTIPSSYSGIVVDRSLQSDTNPYLFIFDESDDRFKIGKLNSLQYVTTRDAESNLTNNHIMIWDSDNKYIKDSGKVTDDFEPKIALGTSGQYWNGEKKWVNMPTKLPNPYSLSITGAVSATYDGSSGVTVTIPSLTGGADATSGQYVSGVTVSGHAITVTKAALPTIPTKLPNPYSLTILNNGAAYATYDGSSGVSIDIAKGSDLSKYLPLAGGTMNAGARISHGDGNLYIGAANNSGWIGLQDICSQANMGDGVWSIRTNGNAIFQKVTSPEFVGRATKLGDGLSYAGCVYSSTTSSMTDNGVLIKLPFPVTSNYMFQFTVKCYKSYNLYNITFSGYLYNNNGGYIYSPFAVMESGNRDVPVIMGYNSSTKAVYVWIGNSSNYTGLAIVDVVSGYKTADWNSGWEVTHADSSIIDTVSLGTTLYPPVTTKQLNNYLPLSGGTVNGDVTVQYLTPTKGITISSVITNLNIAKDSSMGSYLRLDQFNSGTTNVPGTDSISGLSIQDGYTLTYMWGSDYSIQLATDIDGSGIAYRGYTPSTGANKTGWKFLAHTAWVKDTINAYIPTDVGDGTILVHPSNSNEVNFSGTNTADANIYFGYRAVGSRPKPTTYIFGTGSNGDAVIKSAGAYFSSGLFCSRIVTLDATQDLLNFGTIISGSTIVGASIGTTYVRSGATNLMHRRNGSDYSILDTYNYDINNSFVIDDRNTAHTPNLINRKARFWFSNNGTPNSNWWSGLYIKGWNEAYAAWELAGPAHTSVSDSLYFRCGINSTWNSWRRLAFADEVGSTETAATIMSKINSQSEITFTKHVVCTAGAGTSSTSDIRYKHNIEQLPKVLPLVLNSPGIKYNWMEEEDKYIGTSAQYWENKVPELVGKINDACLTFSYERYTIILQEALKEEYNLRLQEAKEYNKKLKSMEDRISKLESLLFK